MSAYKRPQITEKHKEVKYLNMNFELECKLEDMFKELEQEIQEIRAKHENHVRNEGKLLNALQSKLGDKAAAGACQPRDGDRAQRQAQPTGAARRPRNVRARAVARGRSRHAGGRRRRARRRGPLGRPRS